MSHLRRISSSSRLPLAGSTAVSLIAYFVMSKYVAERSGVAGIAVLGVVTAITNVLALIGDVNVGVEMSRRLADDMGRANDSRFRRQLIRATRRITAAASTLLVLALAGFSVWLGQEVGLRWWEVVLAGSAGVATISAQQDFNMLSGLGLPKAVAFGSSMRSVIVLVVLVGSSVLGMSIPGAYTLSMWCGFAVARLAARRVDLGPPCRPPRSLYIDLLKVGRITASTITAYYGVAFALPLILAAFASTELTGWFRATTLLSGGFAQLINSMVRYEYFPRLNRITDRAAAEHAMHLELQLLVGISAAFCLLLTPLRELALTIAFSSQFKNAATLLSFVLIGDLLRCAIAVLGYSLYARNGVKWLLATELTTGVSLGVFLLIAVANHATVLTLGAAYAGAHLVGAIVAIAISTRHLFSTAPISEVGLLSVGIGGVAAGSALTSVSVPLSALVAVAGIAVCVRVVLRARASVSRAVVPSSLP